MRYVLIIMCMLAAIACEPVKGSVTGGALPLPDGGSGGQVMTTGGGGTGGEATTTTPEPPACDADPGCDYPDPLLSYDPAAATAKNIFVPIGAWETNGASEGCAAPLTQPATFTRALVGFSGAPPAGLLLEARFVKTYALDTHVPTFLDAPLESVESGPDGTQIGVYLLPEPIMGGAGHIPCVAVPVSAVHPLAMTQGACADARRSRWLGLPVAPTWTAAADPTMTELTWALLACPVDKTTDDGTPAVSTYKADFLRGVRQ